MATSDYFVRTPTSYTNRVLSLSLSRPHGELLRRPAVDFVNDDDDDDDADADENA